MKELQGEVGAGTPLLHAALPFFRCVQLAGDPRADAGSTSLQVAARPGGVFAINKLI